MQETKELWLYWQSTIQGAPVLHVLHFSAVGHETKLGCRLWRQQNWQTNRGHGPLWIDCDCCTLQLSPSWMRSKGEPGYRKDMSMLTSCDQFTFQLSPAPAHPWPGETNMLVLRVKCCDKSSNSGGGFALWWTVFAVDSMKQSLVLWPSCWIFSPRQDFDWQAPRCTGLQTPLHQWPWTEWSRSCCRLLWRVSNFVAHVRPYLSHCYLARRSAHSFHGIHAMCIVALSLARSQQEKWSS